MIDFVDAHLADDLSLGDLARVAGLSLHHFGAAFRQATGRSAHRYVMEMRLLRADRLLRMSSATIAEIAAATGFASQSHLTAYFKRMRGTTPAKFRDSLT